MNARKIQVADSHSGLPTAAEIGHCGAKWRGRDANGVGLGYECGHVHIDPDRYVQIADEWSAISDGLGINAGKGREMTKNNRFGAKDAQEALVFLISQLAYTEAGLFERYYQPMQNKDFVPQDYSAGEATEVIRWEIYDRVGKAKRINTAGDDIPTADAFYADGTQNVYTGGIGYEYTTQELRATAFLRRPISERRMAAAIEAYERHLSEVGLLGETVGSLTGFLNNANVTHAASPSGLAWSATSGITPIQLLGDFNYGLYQVYANSSFTTIPDTVALPPAAWNYALSTPAAGTTGSFFVSLLEFLKKNNFAKALGVDVDIRPCFDAVSAGVAGNNSRTVYYRKTDQDLVQHTPMPLRFLAPQLVNLKVKVPGEYRYAGVIVRRIPSFYYQDGN